MLSEGSLPLKIISNLCQHFSHPALTENLAKTCWACSTQQRLVWIHSFMVTHLNYFSCSDFPGLSSLSMQSIVQNFSGQILSLITPDITHSKVRGKKPLSQYPTKTTIFNQSRCVQTQLMGRTALTTTQMQEMGMRNGRGKVYLPSGRKPIFSILLWAHKDIPSLIMQHLLAFICGALQATAITLVTQEPH